MRSAAVAVALVAGACTRSASPEAKVTPEPRDAGTNADALGQARQLRFDAGDALDRHEWKKALDLFDRAQALDPAGEGVPWIQNGRSLAREGLSRAASAKP